MTAGSAALGIALLAVLVALIFTLGTVVYRSTQTTTTQIDPLAGRTGTTATTLGEGGSADGPTTDTPEARGVLVRPQAATSSSALASTQSDSYRATNLVDNDSATAWIEGVEGPGIGEWVRFEFLEPVTLARIEIANGYQVDEERFEGNLRVRDLEIEFSNGATQVVRLHDSTDPQSISPRSKTAEWIKLTILSVYPDHVWEDAALSSLLIFEAATQ